MTKITKQDFIFNFIFISGVISITPFLINDYFKVVEIDHFTYKNF